MRRYRTFHIIVHVPQSAEMQKDMAKRVACMHAQAVLEYVKAMSCSAQQKEALVDAVLRCHKAHGAAPL